VNDAVHVDLSKASRYAHAPSWPGAVDTESRLAAIAVGVDAATADWARSMAERINPRAARDGAIRELAKLVPRPSISATARKVEHWLSRYVREIWQLDQERGGPGDGCEALRLQLWRIVKLNRGEALGWRQILRVLER
jgi:hypothetical protein